MSLTMPSQHSYCMSCFLVRPSHVSAPFGTAEDEKYAAIFLETQSLRVVAIDDSLLEATEDILPVSPEAKTITEMAELCRMVQEATRQKTGLLRTRLELLGVKTSWNDSITSPKIVAMDKGNTQIQWSVGGPLDCVIEADVETEGATTPGSLLHPSPFGSTTKRKASLTPTTPTMNKFSFRYVRTLWSATVLGSFPSKSGELIILSPWPFLQMMDAPQF
jgi:hypothetical protein